MKTIAIKPCLILALLIGVEVHAQPAAAPTEATQPDDIGPSSKPTDVVRAVDNAVNAARTGQWIALASAVIMILLNLFRLPALRSLIFKIPARVRIVLPIVLGAAAGGLSMAAGGLPWLEAVWISLVSGPGAVFAHEAVWKSILGKTGKAPDENEVDLPKDRPA